MNFVSLPPRDQWTPELAAAKYLTELEELFVEVAGKSKTWPEEQNPIELFRETVGFFYAGTSGDIERAQYFTDAKKLPAGHFDDHGILNMLSVAVAYCAETLREFRQGDATRAWSLACEAGYWTGYVSVQYVRNVTAIEAVHDWVSDRNRRAANARHEENNAIADDIKKWFLENHKNYKSLDDAAFEATKHHNASFRTARKHIAAVAKEKGINLRSARKT